MQQRIVPPKTSTSLVCMQNLVQYYHLKQTLKEKLQKVDNVIIYLYFVPVKLINLYKLLYLTKWSHRVVTYCC